jgi:hypothetical protein
MARNFTEQVMIFKAKTVTPGSPLIQDTGFPFGGLIRRLDLHLHLTMTQTSASGVVVEGLQRFIKNVVFRGGNDHFVKNVCGRALHAFAQNLLGTEPGKTTLATTTATTYSIHLPILFADMLQDYPNDTAIDARRYVGTGLHFELLPGTVADLFTTVGDSAITVTADLYAEVEQGALAPIGAPGMPKMYRSYVQPAPIDPASITNFELEKNEKLFYRRLLLQASNSATAGAPFSGTIANTTLASVTFESNIRTHVDAVPEENLRFENKSLYCRETVDTGRYMIDLLKGRSNFEMLPADPTVITSLQLQVENKTLSTSQVSAAFDTAMLY